MSSHCKTSAHLKRMNDKTIEPLRTFVDCGETIKIEDTKREIIEQENVEDPLSIHQGIENSNICEDMEREVKVEESVNDPLSIQEIINKSMNKDSSSNRNNFDAADEIETMKEEIDEENEDTT